MFRRIPLILMGLGTTIMTSQHKDNFKRGLLLRFWEGKQLFKLGQKLTNEEFKEHHGNLKCEMYFDSIESLEIYIDNLNEIRDKWNEIRDKRRKANES